MRLLRLSANKDSFRPVIFNRTGLSLVIAEQRSSGASRTKTYNGVGKSLMLKLLHFCLGSNPVKAFQHYLGDWIFFLAVEIDGREYIIERSAAKQREEIFLDRARVTLDELRKFLQDACFSLRGDIPHLAFRPLIQRFIRSGRDAYSSFFFADDSEVKKPYEAMLRNAYLLGLDLHLARAKFDLRQRKLKLQDTMKQLENEPLFADIYAQEPVEIQLLALREQAEKLRRDLKSFSVAEDYHSIEQEANEIKRTLDGLRRESVKLEEAISQIDRSLQVRGDIPEEKIFDLYAEANLVLPEMVKRRVEEVLAFQRDLQSRRIYRLTKERQDLDRQRRSIVEQISAQSNRLDERLRYLSHHRALDEYVAVSNELSELQQRIGKLEESKALQERINKELRRIDRDLADQTIATDEYLQRAELLISEATASFRDFARDLYGSRPSGLSVKNDDGDNQQRYKIAAHITSDAAEGINEAKIFCYDMTVMRLRRGHNVEFLAHDSTLFGPVDPRQRLTMFQIADRLSLEVGTQYIATLNLHDITSISEQTNVSEGEFRRLFSEPSVVLRLADDSPRHKLLGIDVDMNYFS